MVGVVCTFVATCFLFLIVGLCFGFCCSERIMGCCFICCPGCVKVMLRCKGASAAQADQAVQMMEMARGGQSPWATKGKGEDDDNTA